MRKTVLSLSVGSIGRGGVCARAVRMMLDCILGAAVEGNPSQKGRTTCGFHIRVPAPVSGWHHREVDSSEVRWRGSLGRLRIRAVCLTEYSGIWISIGIRYSCYRL